MIAQTDYSKFEPAPNSTVIIEGNIIHPHNWDEDDNGCWIWNRAVNRLSIPLIYDKERRQWPVMRIVLNISDRKLFPIRDENCPPRCVNPDHYTVSAGPNIKKRAITVFEAHYIKFVELGTIDYEDGTYKHFYKYYGQGAALAREYGVPYAMIHCIKNQTTFKYLTRDDSNIDYIYD